MKESEIHDHLPICNNITSFHEGTILSYGDHKYLLELKDNLLIKRDRPVLNKNIVSNELFLLLIIRTLSISIIPQYCFAMVFDMSVAVKVK